MISAQCCNSCRRHDFATATAGAIAVATIAVAAATNTTNGITTATSVVATKDAINDAAYF